MEIPNIQSLNRFKHLFLLAVTLTFFSISNQLFAQGEALFKAKCANCHQPHKNGIGPKLFEARKRWEAAGEGALIIEWVKNNAKLRASGKSARANEIFNEYKGSVMYAFTKLKDDEVISILDWVDAQPDPATAAPTTTNGGPKTPGLESEEESSLSWIWILLGIMFVIIIMAVGGVRRQLNIATSDKDVQEKLTYGEEFRVWAWKNRLYVGITSLVIVIAFTVGILQGLSRINVVENYQPSQPIAFPHSVHAGLNGIDCKYCHNSVEKSKSAGIPSVNVCMNCHKQISGEEKPYESEIKKVYAAAGWDPKNGPTGAYNNKTNPIVWNKVHVLPDHVYFNHSQHVVVGGVDCKQCHGDMTKMKEAAKVQPVSELNKIEGNIKLTKPTLTMGWCIECHGASGVSLGNGKSGYYDEIHRRLLNNDKSLYKKYLKDNTVSVSELGGWECAKCHY